MAALSKHRGLAMINARLPCDVLHPDTPSCARNSLIFFCSALKGTSKFFLLVHLIPLLMKRPVSPELLHKEAKDYIKSCIFGAMCSAVPPGVICLLRWLLGRFYITTTGFIPGSIGGASIFILDSSRKRKNITLLLALVVNLYLKIFEDKGLVTFTLPIELLIFSTCSSGLLYYLRSIPEAHSFLWPFLPQKVPSDMDARKHCQHSGSCIDSTRKIGFAYFLYGLAIQGLKVITINFKLLLSKPKSFFLAFLKLENLRLPLFAGLYISVFKGVSCLLLKLRGRDEAWQAVPAGVVASLCYLIQPNLTLSLFAFSNLSQILCRKYKNKLKLPPWPWEEITFMIIMGLMLHARTAYPECFPHHMTLIMDSISNGRAPIAYGLVESNLVRRF